MIAQPLAYLLVRLVAFGVFAQGCADYATHEDLSVVEQKVETVEYSLQRTRRELRDTVVDTQRGVEAIAMRQAVTEAAVVAMGSGFNELALAVQDAHETSLSVYESQQKLVSDVEARLSDVALEPLPSNPLPDRSYSRYVGQGRDLRLGTALPFWTLDFSGQGSLTRQQSDGTQQRYNLQQAGTILYAMDERGRAVACFERTHDDLSAESDTFQAIDCDNRYGLYEFSPAMETLPRTKP